MTTEQRAVQLYREAALWYEIAAAFQRAVVHPGATTYAWILHPILRINRQSIGLCGAVFATNAYGDQYSVMMGRLHRWRPNPSRGAYWWSTETAEGRDTRVTVAVRCAVAATREAHALCRR